MKRKLSYKNLMLLLGLLLTGLFALGLRLGAVNSSLQELLAEPLILIHVRLPRCLGCILAGSALAVSGLLLQTALANPLASPGIIGINSGSALFVVLASVLFPGLAAAKGAAAFLGALSAALLVFAIGRLAKGSRSVFVLAGVAVSSLFSALSDTLITLFPSSITDKTAFTVGSFAGLSLHRLLPAVLCIPPALLAAFLAARALDILTLGDDMAASLGLSVRRVRFLCLTLSALLAAAGVMTAGLLNFLGLIVPHIIRKVLKTSEHRRLVPAAALGGGVLALLCDLLARTLFAPYELPVGILLSLLGVPFFLYLLGEGKTL